MPDTERAMAITIAFTVLGIVLGVAFIATERTKTRPGASSPLDSFTTPTLADTLFLNFFPAELARRPAARIVILEKTAQAMPVVVHAVTLPVRNRRAA